jgi:glucose-1-phosphate thymidylyltransferase
MKGILLAGGRGTRLHPLTLNISKQLLPVYDKPMIYYPISTLMHMGIRDIAVISDSSNLKDFMSLLGDGSQWGINLEFFSQKSPEGIAQAYLITKDFSKNSNTCLILGDNLFVWPGMKPLVSGATLSSGARIFAYEVYNPKAYGNIAIDENGVVTDLIEKPEIPISNFAVPGIYITDESAPDRAKSLVKSKRGEYEIVDLLITYMKEDKLFASLLPRGTAWFDTGSISDLYSAAEFIKIIQERQGQLVGSPEEIAFRNGWLSKEEIFRNLPKDSKSQYYLKLRNVLSSV